MGLLISNFNCDSLFLALFNYKIPIKLLIYIINPVIYVLYYQEKYYCYVHQNFTKI